MRCLRSLILVALASGAASHGLAATHPPMLAGLVDRARALPPEFAADALLRITGVPAFTDAAWKREVLEDAFHLASSAQEPFARRNWTGSPASIFEKAYAQGLDACTLQCKAVHAMLAIDYRKARELFDQILPPQIPALSCDDTLVYDVSILYATANEVSARAFSAKEVADEEPFHLLQRYAAAMTSPVEAAPIARMLVGASLKPAQFEALVDSFAGALTVLSGDDRSFSATNVTDPDAALAGLPAECARRQVNAQPLLAAWRSYVARQLGGTRCKDSAAPAARPSGQCDSPQCRQLAAQFASLVVGPNSYGLTQEQKATSDWSGKLRKYLADLAAWTDDDDPVEYFQSKSRFYGDLFNLAPSGPDRDFLFSALLTWLQQNDYQRDHRVEWFYPVNTLIIHASADPVAMQLRRSADPVISFYAQLEQLTPRPMDATLCLL